MAYYYSSFALYTLIQPSGQTIAHDAHPMQVSLISSQNAYPLWLTSLVVSASVCVGHATTQSPHPLHLLVSMTRAPLILLILLYISFYLNPLMTKAAGFYKTQFCCLMRKGNESFFSSCLSAIRVMGY